MANIVVLDHDEDDNVTLDDEEVQVITGVRVINLHASPIPNTRSQMNPARTASQLASSTWTFQTLNLRPDADVTHLQAVSGSPDTLWVPNSSPKSQNLQPVAPIYENWRKRKHDSMMDSGGASVRRMTKEKAEELMRAEVITIDDEEDEVELLSVSDQPHSKTRSQRGPREGDVLINLEQIEDEILGENSPPNRKFQRKFVATANRRASTLIPPRIPSIRGHYEVWNAAAMTPSGERIKAGVTAEVLLPGQTRADATFLYVTSVVKNRERGNFLLRGHNLIRTRDLNDILPKKCNELVWEMEIDLDDPRPQEIQSQSEIPLEHVHGKRDVRFTNASFPAFSFRDDKTSVRSQESMETDGPLVCRWKFTRTYPNAKDRILNMQADKALEHFREQDLALFRQSDNGVRDFRRREAFRGPTILGGSHIPGNKDPVHLKASRNSTASSGPHTLQKVPIGLKPPCQTNNGIDEDERYRRAIVTSMEMAMTEAACRRSNKITIDDTACANSTVVDLTSEHSASQTVAEKPRTVTVHGQRYKYGDAFCGGGGTTRGAKMAGLNITWGIDDWDRAAQTWAENFPRGTMLQARADLAVDKARMGSLNLKVDILHLSPPCQFWSPAHTVTSQNDDANSASLFACGHLLDVAQPRIATLEQTFGLATSQFQHFFHCLIKDFTERGYSIRWKVVPFMAWGLPARRYRLIMIASCPGEPLPPFPSPTHAPAPLSEYDRAHGLLPYKTVNQAIEDLPRTPIHRPSHMRRFSTRKAPWDGDSILPRCMTTCGGQNYHPDGWRDLTLGEYAALQGFPPEHTFRGTCIKKIIGNSVPPVVASVIFTHIKKWLEEQDGVVQPPPTPLTPQIKRFPRTPTIVIDD